MSGIPPSHPFADREHRDALSHGAVRGRGANLNPGNRFETVRLHVLGEHLDEIRAERADGTQVLTRLYRDATRNALNKVVDSPDIGFDWTVNPYRGCEHGCIYCYARPFHEYLGFSSGLDFETKIVVKYDAPALLRDALAAESWKGETIVMSGVTDPYQPVESRLGITRGCLEVMADCGQPVAIITKNALVTRDIDLLSSLAARGAASVGLSITTLDHDLATKMEPRASSPRKRLAAVAQLAAAGIPVKVMMAPIIPGLTDHEVPTLLKACADAGASGAGFVLLRLPHQIKDLFLEWLQRHFPDRAARVESQVREARGGKLYNSEFFERQRGTGARAQQIEQAFRVFKQRYGLDRPSAPLSSQQFRRPQKGGQLGLF